MKIGEKLKKGRLDIDMTQEEVSKIINVSRSTISSWEVNRTYPDLEMLVTLSDLYNISLDVILREDNQMVKKIDNEVKTSKKRKKLIVIILVLTIPTILFLGFKLWNIGLVVSPDQIRDVEIELNGESLNSESTIELTLEFGNFKEYSGYWIETNDTKDTLEIQVYQNYSLSGNKQEVVDIDLNILEYAEGISRITLNGYDYNVAEELYKD